MQIYFRHNKNHNLIVRFVEPKSRAFDAPGRYFYVDIRTDQPFICDDMDQFRKDYTVITDEDEVGLLLLKELP